MKRFLIITLILFFGATFANAQEFLQGNLTEDILFKGSPVRVTPVKKITTSKKSMKVGNDVFFITSRDVLENESVIIKRNTPVKGKVLSISPNKYIGTQAVMTMGDFETTDVFGEIVPLKGEIKKEGNPHNTLISYLDFLAVFIRGGEVQIIPEEDYFILFY